MHRLSRRSGGAGWDHLLSAAVPRERGEPDEDSCGAAASSPVRMGIPPMRSRPSERCVQSRRRILKFLRTRPLTGDQAVPYMASIDDGGGAEAVRTDRNELVRV